MNKIENVKTEEMGKSAFVRPFRLRYSQNGKTKIWDCIHAHDSVAVLIHHIERDSFIFVRQFRPAVYVGNIRRTNNGVISDVDSSQYPGDTGITYELCAGILDKSDASPKEVARMEVLEECGYDVPMENIEEITEGNADVGIMGTKQTVFYARVTDAMKKTEGGGREEEGEMIECEEVAVKDSIAFALNKSIPRHMGMNFAIFWYHHMKSKASCTTTS